MKRMEYQSSPVGRYRLHRAIKDALGGRQTINDEIAHGTSDGKKTIGEVLDPVIRRYRTIMVMAFHRRVPARDIFRSVIGVSSGAVSYPKLEAPEGAKKKRILIFAPHPDDEVLGCGGTIAKYATEGSSIKVAYVTDGRNGNPRFSAEEMVIERKKEGIEGLRALGCGDNVFMDYPDSGLKANKESIERTLRLIEEYGPDAIFTPNPLDNHPDHICTTQMVAAALKSYTEDTDCYCYEVWSALTPNTLVDITDEMEKKVEAIGKHRSQIEIIDYTEKIVGLNAFRSLTAGNGIRYCEAFYKSSREDFIKLVERSRTSG